jgi:hypothetical protein
MTVLRVFLVVCVLVVVGASADASASSTATGMWTLTVTFAGTGTGLVTTIPAGIVCTNDNPAYTPAGTMPPPLGTCSAQFQVGVAPWVIATPSGGTRGSLLGGISNCEGEHGSCQAFPPDNGVGNVQVTFNARPIPCTVERVIGQPLAQAKRSLRFIGCKIGTVRYVYSSTNLNFGDVISQNPTRLWQRPHGAVNLVVSKGKRET